MHSGQQFFYEVNLKLKSVMLYSDVADAGEGCEAQCNCYRIRVAVHNKPFDYYGSFQLPSGQ
jgi:hypothetical protein